MIIAIKMFYNYNELNKYGFYPKLNTDDTNREIVISFYLKEINNDYYWIQRDQSVIYGFTKKDGIELLSSLNETIKHLNIQAKYILNSGGRKVFPICNNATYYILENYNK
jgi:hypothetical protein